MSSLLSHCAVYLQTYLVLSDHLDVVGNKLYPQSFTLGELKDALRTYTSRNLSASLWSSLPEAMISSLEMQMFFYIATWKSVERATDDDICILLRCDANESREQSTSSLRSSPVPSVSTSASRSTSPASGAAVSTAMAVSSTITTHSNTTDCLPTGVMPSLSKCYSATCDELYPCYSSSCPNRAKKYSFTVRCYSNSCGSGYGCYSPTCPCRYESEADPPGSDPVVESILTTDTLMEVEPTFPTNPHFNAIPGQPTPRSTAGLPKLFLGTVGAMPHSQNYSQDSPLLVSPATTLSSYSFSSSLTLSSPSFSTLSPMSPFSPAAWPTSSPIDVNITSSHSPVAPTLPRLFTHFPNFNSYSYHPEPSPSYHSNPDSSYYAPSPAGISTPDSPNWEPLLLISMIGPSITWVNREISSTPPRSPTAQDEGDTQSSYSRTSHAYSHVTPQPRCLFSSILSKYIADDPSDDEHHNTSQSTEAELKSPAAPYSPNPLSPF